MRFEQALKETGKGKVIFLKTKPDVFIFVDVHMQEIAPELYYKPYVAYNIKTYQEKHCEYSELKKLFTEAELNSEDWIVQSAQDIPSCKDFLEKTINFKKLKKTIKKLRKARKKFYDELSKIDKIKPMEQVYFNAIDFQFNQSYASLQRVLMYAGLSYELKDIIKNWEH